MKKYFALPRAYRQTEIFLLYIYFKNTNTHTAVAVHQISLNIQLIKINFGTVFDRKTFERLVVYTHTCAVFHVRST